MKKLSFFLMAMLFSVMSFAAEVTETVTMKGFAGLSTSAYENVTKTGASDKGTAMVAYAFNPSTGQVRGNKTQIAGASVTSKDDAKNWSLYNVDAMAGAIKSIKITCAADGSNYFKSNMYVALGTSSQGAVTTISGAQKNTTASNAEFTFDIDATKGYTYFKLLSNEKFTSGSVKGVVVTITYEAADNYVAVPSITGETYFKENTTVTLTASEGQKVYYTLDGTEPTNASTEYTAPFELTETTTVKAIAYQGENASEVAEQVFKKMQVLTCAEAAAITPNGDKYIVRGYVTSASEYNTQYNNIDFFVADTKDGGEVLKAYRAIPVTEEDKAVKEGDYVEVIGELAAFYETIQIAQGGTYTIIPEPVVEEEIYYEPYVLDNLEVTDNGDSYVLYATISDYNLELTFGVNAADGTLMEESSIVFGGEVLPIVSSEPVTVEFNEEVQTNVYTVRVVVEMRDGKVGFEFNMYTAADSGDSTEPVAIAVVGATASVSNDGWLVINGTWNELPFVLKVAGYEDTPYKEYTGTQVGEMEFGEWGVTESDFGFADAVTVIKNVDNLDIMGLFESLSSGTTYNVSVSASFAAVDPETAVDNINASAAPAKMIVNGQLIIVKDGVKFNAAGAVVK